MSSMDEEGFREFQLKKKRSPRGVDIYVTMLKKYQNFLQKHKGHNEINLSSTEDLIAFGKWLKEENFQQTIINVYKLALKDYFIYKEEVKLAEIVENGFKN